MNWGRPVLCSYMTCSQHPAKSCGTRSLLKEYPTRRGPFQHGTGVSWVQHAREMLEPSCCPCPPAGAALKHGRPRCFPTLAPEGEGPAPPSGARWHNTIGQRGTAANSGLAGQERCQRGIGQAHPSTSVGPRASGTRHAGASLAPPTAVLPYPLHRGDPSQTGDHRHRGAAVNPWPHHQAPHSRNTLPTPPSYRSASFHQPHRSLCRGTGSSNPATDTPQRPRLRRAPCSNANSMRGCEEPSREPSVPSTNGCCSLRPHTSTSALALW